MVTSAFKTQGSPRIYKRTQVGYKGSATLLLSPEAQEQIVPALKKPEGPEFTSWFKYMGNWAGYRTSLRLSFPIYKAERISTFKAALRIECIKPLTQH